ncbi:MAG: 4-hydroxy-3-methylbut-2-enyl diphosphate reductase, partial [Planctomycetota bacterium]
DEVYSLGPIIHNKDVVEQLAQTGLKTVSKVEDIQSGTVLIRSHGAAPQQLAKLREKGINIVDATCVLVKRLQHIAGEFERDGYKVVIIGDENHPEVQAVVGCVKEAVVIADESDLNKLAKNDKLGIVCQTTESPDHFGRMLGAIGRGSFRELKVINTLCEEAIKRQQSAVQLCKRVDIMFVLGGLESANTRRLADLCKNENSQTYHLQNWNELDKRILFGKKIAGVTAGASTPEWIIAEFVENLEAFEVNEE